LGRSGRGGDAMKTRSKQWLAAGVGLLLVVGSLVGVKAGQIGLMIASGKTFSPPPESVTSALVQASEWQPSQPATGSVVAVRGVTLGAELPGTIREIDFDSGMWVKQGAVLVRLDTSTEEAQLVAARAEATLARLNLERARSLRQGDVNTPADLEAVEARAAQAGAAVAGLEAAIAKKTIRAPFDGRIAIRQVELGQVVTPGTPVASLQSVDPTFVDFWLPQQALATVKVGQQVRLRTDTYPGASWDGRLATINPEVDPVTRSVRLRASFGNADGRLRPGMYASVEVLSGERQPVLLVPATAAIYAPYGDSVFVLEPSAEAGKPPGTVARQRFVRLGERRGDLVAVVSGLKAGETVVSSGAFKLRNGAAVVVHEGQAPAAELDPRPVDR
jgi:membrane fusion protein (multidrug efflux system)